MSLFIVKGRMGFDINKYDKIRFHTNSLIQKRVKALYLWFDYEVNKRDLDYKGQVRLIDEWVEILIEYEYYEVVPFFKRRRYDILKSIIRERNANMSRKDRLVLLLKFVKIKIRRFVRGFIIK